MKSVVHMYILKYIHIQIGKRLMKHMFSGSISINRNIITISVFSIVINL